MQKAIVEKRPIDPDFMRVIKIIEKKTPSEIAKGGMVGASTIRNWRKGGGAPSRVLYNSGSAQSVRV